MSNAGDPDQAGHASTGVDEPVLRVPVGRERIVVSK